MKLATYVANFLKREGVDTVFGYQGGAITHLVDSLSKTEGIEFFSTYHEQGAAFAAEGYARVKGDIGVAIATSGPGATNLITGIGSSFFDSIPCLYITGQVNTYEYKKSDKIRQAGFQETDIVSLVKPITKFAKRLTDPSLIRYTLEEALSIARGGRPGPVLIDIPMDIQRAEIDEKSLIGYNPKENRKYLAEMAKEIREIEDKGKEIEIKETIADILSLLKTSKRPMILAGGGIRLAKADKELSRFIHLVHLPVAVTLMGLDSISHDDVEFAGFIGAYGNRYANLALANSDFILVLGSRLTSRQTSPYPETFARGARIIHIDIDENELNRAVKVERGLKCHLRDFLKKLNEKLQEENVAYDFSSWLNQIKDYQKAYPSYPTQQEINPIDPNTFMKKLSEKVKEDTIVCTDVGQNQIWIAQSFKIKDKMRVLTSGGMGAMGFALPCAIGAFKANPRAVVIAIAGDGGIQMNIQELQTIIRENIPIKLFVMNNKALGMIRHFQEMYFDSRYYGTLKGYSVPDFVKLGEAYGIASKHISAYKDLDDILPLLADDKAYLFEINLKEMTYVIPKLSMGRPIEDQDPLLSRECFKELMIIPPLENTEESD